MATSALHKAAVVLSSLPKKQAAALLGRLTAAEEAAVRDEIAGIGRIGRRRRETALREFTAHAAARAAASQKPCEKYETASGHDPSHFQILHEMETDDLLTLLADEHPQTVALILSHLPPGRAANALAAMPSERQTSVIRRIAAMAEPSEEIIRDVEEAIRRRLNGTGRGGIGIGMASIVKMLGAMPPASERRLLGELAQADPELFGDIRWAMFGPDVAGCEIASEAACEAASG